MDQSIKWFSSDDKTSQTQHTRTLLLPVAITSARRPIIVSSKLSEKLQTHKNSVASQTLDPTHLYVLEAHSHYKVGSPVGETSYSNG